MAPGRWVWLVAGWAVLSPAQDPTDPKIKAALEYIRRIEPELLEEQVRLTEIPAPPFEERVRAAAYKQVFERLGLKNVRIDKEGNVLGERPGRGPSPRLVFSAHLDTVFPAGTDVRVKREGTRLTAPGIGDDGRGLAVVIGVIRALDHAGIETDGPITFVGTVGEEGLGDLRGVKHLFGAELKGRIDRFVSVDGTGLGITNTGVGSYRYKVSYAGLGGHSFGSFGMANPIHALGRLIAKVAEFQTPAQPKTTFNVGRIGGGTSVNSIPFEASLEVDMRSSDKGSLEALHEKFKQAAALALSEENERWKNNGRLSMKVDLLGYRPGGETPARSAEVQAVARVTGALGFPVALREGSTDANVGMGLGIPSVTIAGGGTGTGAHSPQEAFDTTDSWKGTQRALLAAVALASR
ncbi:MAG: M20/M25/M40 family metallo-hydrolase [Acidobacteria bacterium]|nr:M20/M25/M40 family metallo-hydrolase [Acidobacteriota bacterium]